MDLVNHLDFWLMVVTFAFLFYYFVWKKIEHWTRAIVSWMIWSIISAFRDGHEVMSSEAENAVTQKSVAAPVAGELSEGAQPIATTGNAINKELSGNAIAQPLIPEEARDIIRFQAKIEVLAELIKAGDVSNKAMGIEHAFKCSRTSREDSVYQKARRALDPLLDEKPQYPQPLTPEQEGMRQGLGLQN
jgi:uncharacterized membrane protein